MVVASTLLVALVVVWFSVLASRRSREFDELARPRAGDDPGSLPRVSVIVPVRNEERNVRACLSALLAQTYPNFELIVVDDGSTDRTPQIVRESASDPRLRTLPAPPLPPGWMGKCHALWVGSQSATGDWLYFLDADTFAEPELLAATVAHAEKRGLDVICPLPGQDLGSPAEHIFQPVVFAMSPLFMPPARINDPDDPLGCVAGQCLGMRRSAYDALGGHSHPAVRGSFAEDTVLGQAIKSAGFRMELVDGRGLVHTRMYTSLAEVWNGWTRLCRPGLGERWYLAPIAVIASLAILAYFVAVVGFGVGSDEWPWARLVNGVILAYLLAFLGWMRWKVGQVYGEPIWYTLTYPLGALFLAGITVAALLRNRLGSSVQFRGRQYAA